MQEALERIFELTGDTPSRGGGGKGQTMTVHYKGRAVVGHGGSKIAAITDLLHQVEDLTPTFDVPVPRASVDDALEQIRQVTGPDVEVLDEGERGAVWDRTNTRLVAIFPCAGECMVSKSPVCECECGGSNHGILVRLLSQSVPGTGGKPIMLGPKPCACGCGGTTNRKYVPGHDARHHAALKRAAAEAQA